MDGNTSQRQFSELLRSYRIRRGVTQRQLADLSTVSVRAIRDLELGRTSRPRHDTVRLIADGLGLSGRSLVDFRAAAAAHGMVSRSDLKMMYDAEPVAPPAPLDTLIGRELEVAVVGDMLATGSQRLITVTGLGGVGKTRLALEIANELHGRHGYPVLWCGADPAADLVQLCLDALTGSGEAAGELATVIGDRPTLLVLDAPRPLRIRVDRVVALLQECRGLRVLATSREPLDVRAERTFPLAPLALPRPGSQDVASSPAVRLLVHHVRQVRPEFAVTGANAAAVAELCRRLDGIPAALAAAASWFMLYDAETLLDCLRQDPVGFAVEKLPDLADLVGRTVAALPGAEHAVLTALGAAPPGWSMAEAVELTGRTPVACARMVRMLLILGLVRSVDESDRTRFQVLDLVAAVADSRRLAVPEAV